MLICHSSPRQRMAIWIIYYILHFLSYFSFSSMIFYTAVQPLSLMVIHLGSSFSQTGLLWSLSGTHPLSNHAATFQLACSLNYSHHYWHLLIFFTPSSFPIQLKFQDTTVQSPKLSCPFDVYHTYPATLWPLQNSTIHFLHASGGLLHKMTQFRKLVALKSLVTNLKWLFQLSPHTAQQWH